MVNIEKRHCKVCGCLGTRVQNGSFESKKCSKRWIGEDGKQWNGLVCSKCQVKRSRVNMRILRLKRKGSKNNEPKPEN